MDLTSLLQSQLSEGMIDQLSQQLGGAPKEQTQTAAAGIMNILMGAMARNAATPQGAQALNNALERDHDGSVLDNVMDLLGGGGSRSVSNVNERALNGSGILEHILGSRQSGAVDMALLPRALQAAGAVEVPLDWYQPVAQYAVVLNHSAAVDEYLQWLRSDTVRSLITDAGYEPCP